MIFSWLLKRTKNSRFGQSLHTAPQCVRYQPADLAAIATLTAGVAHELSTPLGTIAVISADFERQACEVCRNGECKADARLIRTQLERCREILDRMRLSGMRENAEVVERLDLWSLRDLAIEKMHRTHPQERLVWQCADEYVVLRNVDGAARCVAVLVDNALDATEVSRGKIQVRLQVRRDRLLCEVHNEGEPIPSEVLSQLGTPFFTTKPPGQGMGLGLFIVKTFAAEHGGQFMITSSDSGTTAHLWLPLENRRS